MSSRIRNLIEQSSDIRYAPKRQKGIEGEGTGLKYGLHLGKQVWIA